MADEAIKRDHTNADIYLCVSKFLDREYILLNDGRSMNKEMLLTEALKWNPNNINVQAALSLHRLHEKGFSFDRDV